MAFDFSMYGRQIAADQSAKELALKQQLGAQQLQQGAVDTQSKKTLYAVQLLSGAQDPDTWARTKTLLGGMGVDTSMFSDDFNTGKQQVEGVRQAFYNANPLNQWMNLQMKAEANGIQATNAMGSTSGARTLVPVSSAILNSTPPGMAPAIPPIAATTSGMPQNIQRGAQPASYQPIPTPVAEQGVQTQGSVGGMPLSGQANSQLGQALGEMNFVPPARDLGETQSAYNQKYQQAMDAFKADPAYQAQVEQMKSKASALGKDQGEAVKHDIASKQGMDQITQNLDAIIQLADQVPQQRYGTSPQLQAWFSQNFGDQTKANAQKQFDLINEAQTINAIKELAATGQIRMNQRLEGMVNRGYLVDPNASPEEKKNQASAIKTELTNAAIQAHNINTGLNGGQQQPYQAVPTGLGAAVPSSQNDPLGIR